MKAFLLVLALIATGVRAQSAADLYHDAVRLYIDGQREPAEQAALQGLALDPDDARLKALLARIREEQPPRNGGENPVQNEEREASSQNGDPSRQGQNDAERPDDPAAADQTRAEPEEEDDAPEKREPGETGRRDGARPGEGEATPQGDGPVETGRMTREEAERLLNAVGADEERLLQRMQRQQTRPRRVTRDW